MAFRRRWPWLSPLWRLSPAPRWRGQPLLHLAVEDVLRRPLVFERDIRRHRAFGPDAAQANHQRLERMLQHRLGGGRLAAATRATF
jgi:hypothetical protein